MRAACLPKASVLALASGLALSGCAALNPAGWFHHREGGVIAKDNGPIPGANHPYPNLATVPPAPAPPDLAALHAISAGLISDRAHAHHLAEAAPLPDPSRPGTSPSLFGVGSLPPPVVPPAVTAASGASATMPAVTAKPAAPRPPPAPPSRAPVGAVHAASLPPPAAPVPTVPTPAASAAPAAAPAASAPAALPVIPAAPPPAPRLAATAPVAPAARGTRGGAPPSPPAEAAATDQVAVAFGSGGTTLTPAGQAALHALAARRGTSRIIAIGRGAARSADPSAQLVATRLGLARARAIAAALVADGVPAAAIMIRADASGTGGAAGLQ